MTAAVARVPVLPRPPFDPLSLLLNGRVGWRLLDAPVNVELDQADGALRLAPAAGSLPPFANTAGTLGNLVPPSTVAVGADGTILLLDTARAILRRFDPCACAFVEVRGIGGTGAPPRQWQDPHGIATCAGDLFVCDTGHERVAVYTLNGLAFRDDLRPPAADYPHWEPYAVAVDHRRRAFVADRAAGLLHCFDRRGRWQRAFAGFSQPTAIAIDCSGRLFVTQTGASGLEVRVVDLEGAAIAVAPRPDLLGRAFPALPFDVDAAGNLHLGRLCQPPAKCSDAVPGSGWFDLAGQSLPVAPKAIASSYTGSGTAIVGPLDSRIAACLWHRVILDGVIPEDAKILVETFTADQVYTPDQVHAVAGWRTSQAARRVAGRWDCLTRSERGRFLWLRLTLISMAGSTPVLRQAIVEFPRLSIRRYLPAIFGAEPVSADFTDRFLALFDTTFRSIERQVDDEAALFDPLSAPANRVNGAPVDMLSFLASWIGLTLDRRLDERRRRQLVKHAGALLDRRGTLRGLRDELALLLGFDRLRTQCRAVPVDQRRCCRPPRNCAPDPPSLGWTPPPLVLEHFRLRRWLYLGEGRLGAQAVLWGQRIVNRTELDAGARLGASKLVSTPDPLRDPYGVFAHRFTVFVPCRYRASDSARRALESIIRTDSPAHTQHQIAFVEPRFRIGVQSMIGFDAVVGAVPRGVRLQSSPLGAATVLTTRQGPRLPFAVGEARIGTRDRIG